MGNKSLVGAKVFKDQEAQVSHPSSFHAKVQKDINTERANA